MKIAILTTRGGQGLISGSRAIKEALHEVSPGGLEVEIIDFFDRYSASGAWLTSIYNFLLRRSLRLNTMYIRVLHLLRPDRWRFLYGKPLQGFEKFLEEVRPDVLVLTSQYIVALIGYAYSSGKVKLPSPRPMLCVGNIDPGTSCVPLWFDDAVDLHLIPTPECMTAYLRYGHHPAKAEQARLVVRRAFLDAAREDRMKLRKELGWGENEFIVLFAGSREGYSGVLPLVAALAAASAKSNGTERIAVICGENASLKTELEALGSSRVEALGWRNDVHRLMRAADIIVAKPGKQTMKETITVGTPLISIAYPAVMEQELGNLEFMENRGILLRGGSAAEVLGWVNRLRKNSELMNAYRRKVAEASRAIDPLAVARILLRRESQFRRTPEEQ